MLDKLFVRVRSWLHNDPAGVGGDPALPAPVQAKDKPRKPSKNTPVPPPLPPDAWQGQGPGPGQHFGKEQESGMVITESGIIIIDPAALDAAPPARTGTLPADSAWAMPSLPKPGSTPVSSQATSPSPAPMSSAATSDWDEVLARAKARISGAGVTPGKTHAK